ncbi:MAG: glycosyltransferase family 4 protein [Planctomycetota bacterium]|nr:glycosyltransferase family 4 protein [Planctomycetota bacterium]
MHVLLLNQAFYPDVVATAQMGKDLADHLVRQGHSVSAIASRSIYGQSGASLPKRETVDGIEIHRVGFSLFGKSSIFARILDFLFFYLLATVRLLTMKRPDVVIAYTTPPFIMLAALVCRALRGSKAVYWVMDLYPDLPVACGVMKPESALTGFLERTHRYLLFHADATVVLGRCMREKVLSKHIPPNRLVMIPVWSDLHLTSEQQAGQSQGRSLGQATREAMGVAPGEFLVMYSGNLGLGHDARTMAEAIKLLRDERSIRFVFVGGGKRRKEIQDFAEREGLTNVRFEPYRPREEIADSLSAADLHLISLKEGVEGIMVPSKLFGIMAVGRASVFIGHPESEIARVLDETGSGVTVREGDAAKLADAIRELARDRAKCAAMGVKAREGLKGAYDQTTACDAWAALLERLTAPDDDPRKSEHPALAAPIWNPNPWHTTHAS